MTTFGNWDKEAFEKFKDLFGGGGGGGGADPLFSMPITKMAKEIPRDWWGRYTNPSEGTEARVYARVVYFSTRISDDKLMVDSFGAGKAVLTHPSKPGTAYPATFEGVNSSAPMVTIGTNKKQMTRVERYDDGEVPSDLSMIPIIMVVMVIVALAFAFK